MAISAATLQRLRRRLGWTQRELAENLEVDPMTVSRWERGLSSPRRGIRNRLDALAAQIPAKPREQNPRPTLSTRERIDELVRIVGLDAALHALRQIALLQRKRAPVHFVDDPNKRMREVEAALREQSALLARAKIR